MTRKCELMVQIHFTRYFSNESEFLFSPHFRPICHDFYDYCLRFFPHFIKTFPCFRFLNINLYHSKRLEKCAIREWLTFGHFLAKYWKPKDVNVETNTISERDLDNSERVCCLGNLTYQSIDKIFSKGEIIFNFSFTGLF